MRAMTALAVTVTMVAACWEQARSELAAKGPIRPSKYDVDILYASPGSYVGHSKVFRYSPSKRRIWLGTYAIFGQNTDAFHERLARPIVVSDDLGLTWRLWKGKLPRITAATIQGGDTADAAQYLANGTMVQLGAASWERHPRGEVQRLRRSGYCVWDVGKDAGYCAIIYTCWLRRSMDRGKTWKEIAVHKQLPRFARLYAPYSPLALEDGSFVLFVYGMQRRSDRMSSYVLRTTNAGDDWKIVMIGDGRVSPAKDSTYAHIDSRAGFGEIRAINLGKGRLLALLRSQVGMPTFIVTSKDYGQTWTKPSQTPLIAKHVNATKLSDGSILCTYQRRYARPFGVRARVTSDLGKTWSDEIIIRDDIPYGDGLSEPFTFQLADGSLFTTFFGYQKVKGSKTPFVGATRWSLPPSKVSGTSKWTRGYRWIPKIPRPPARPKLNLNTRGKSPWQLPQ